jgi:acetoin:2,6-dichlorophenolindophenol oxidoreductase subunit alpha
MDVDLWALYAQMYRSRLFETEVTRLWEEGLISGEMHLGTGEEAIVAGVVAQLQDGDAMALDHRGSPPLLMRGVDPVLLLREFMGCPDGLCGGQGGHMHLFSKEHLAASSGIVGASGPAGVGFALSAQFMRPGKVSVTFFGEGAANQGMLLESLNLAALWRLPIVFVCKDNNWEITTPASSAVSGDLVERAQAFGLQAVKVDGADVEAIFKAAGQALRRARNGGGPTFIHATCIHLEGHFLGDPLLRTARHPLREMLRTAIPLLKSLFQMKGAPFRERLTSLKTILALISGVRKALPAMTNADPLIKTRFKLQHDPGRLQALEANIRQEIDQIIVAARAAGQAGAP